MSLAEMAAILVSDLSLALDGLALGTTYHAGTQVAVGAVGVLVGLLVSVAEGGVPVMVGVAVGGLPVGVDVGLVGVLVGALVGLPVRVLVRIGLFVAVGVMVRV